MLNKDQEVMFELYECEATSEYIATKVKIIK